MGIFSFRNQDDDARPTRGARTNPRGERGYGGERGQRRTRRSERPAADALMLDPTLPEKQRARRRLVGAIALVVAAVIVLPLVLDSRPKPVTSDIAIDIPNPPPSATASTSNANSDTAPEQGASMGGLALAAPGAANGSNASNTSTGSNASAASNTPAAQGTPAGSGAPQALAAAKPAPVPAAPKPAAKTPPAKLSAAADTDTAAAADGGDASSPASPLGARFAVQLGSFRDEATAQSWLTRLRKLDVPAYIEHRQQANGQTAVLLRAGPFADRATAAEAVAKVRGAGLAQ